MSDEVHSRITAPWMKQVSFLPQFVPRFLHLPDIVLWCVHVCYPRTVRHGGCGCSPGWGHQNDRYNAKGVAPVTEPLATWQCGLLLLLLFFFVSQSPRCSLQPLFTGLFPRVRPSPLAACLSLLSFVPVPAVHCSRCSPFSFLISQSPWLWLCLNSLVGSPTSCRWWLPW